MKKLVLTLLLTIPYFICGSEAPQWIREDGDSYLNNRVTIFKQSDGSRLLEADSWGRPFLSPEHLQYSVGIDRRFLCMAALAKNIDSVDVQFTLFKETGEKLVDGTCHISCLLDRDTELISDFRETRETRSEADAKLAEEDLRKQAKPGHNNLVVATRVSGRPEQVSRGGSNRRKIRALLRGSIMRQVCSTEGVQNSLFTNVPDSISVVSDKVSCNILDMPYRK